MAAFGLGDNDKMIGYAETQGAAFAVIEGRNAKLEERIAEKGREVAELKRAVEAPRVRASPDGRVGQSPKGAAADSEHTVGDLRPTMGCMSTRHRRESTEGVTPTPTPTPMTPPTNVSPGMIKIVDLSTLEQADAVRLHRLFAAFENLYRAAFPDPSERELADDWIARLRGKQLPPQPDVVVLLAVGDGDRVLGGVCAEHYRSSRCGLVTYIAVAPQHRGAGVARMLMRAAVGRLDALACDQGEPLRAIFAEAEDPSKVDATLHATASERLRILGRFGARAVDLRYVQPGLSGGGGRARHLMLLRLGGGDPPIERAIVHDFMHEFYRALGIPDAEADPDFASMFAGTGVYLDTLALQAPLPAPGPSAESR